MIKLWCVMYVSASVGQGPPDLVPFSDKPFDRDHQYQAHVMGYRITPIGSDLLIFSLFSFLCQLGSIGPTCSLFFSFQSVWQWQDAVFSFHVQWVHRPGKNVSYRGLWWHDLLCIMTCMICYVIFQGRSQAEAEEAAASSDSGTGKQKF